MLASLTWGGGRRLGGTLPELELVTAVLRQAVKDRHSRNATRAADARDWLQSAECRHWCQSLGMDDVPPALYRRWVPSLVHGQAQPEPSAPEVQPVAVKCSERPQPGPRARNPPPGGGPADRPSPLIGARALQAELARPGNTQEVVAKRHGMSRSALANKVRLLQLPHRAQLAIARGSIGEHHGRILLSAMRHGQGVYQAMVNELLGPETPTVQAATELLQQLVGECFRETSAMG